MKLCEALRVECLEFYELLIAFSYLRNRGETLLISACLGVESDQSAIKLASELLSLSVEQAVVLATRVLCDAGVGWVNTDVGLRDKLQSVVRQI